MHRTFCVSFLLEASGKGIAFCHTGVTFYFSLRLMREERNLVVKSSLSPLACFVPPVLSFHSLQRAAEAKLQQIQAFSW